MPPSQDQSSPSRPSWTDRTSQIATAVAAGTFVNVFSDRTALQGLAVAAVTALSLVTVKWLRKRPGAAMTRYATRIAACGALAGSAWAATASTTLAVTIAVISAVFGGAAVIMQSDPTRAIKLLMRMIAAGTTVTMVGSGAQALLNGDDRIAFVCVILGCALAGVTVWADDLLEHATGAFAVTMAAAALSLLMAGIAIMPGERRCSPRRRSRSA
ncbi:hypothetical protein [Nucisporomicrobium flavum]|uniref:hypothetical protein n=1 Tax=Nucisporomicrobium flavum TaxID=2785915 RepID=UPI0018F6C464|nr:hypothetical protein [Nucisporomicrobium flavum]